MKYFLPLLFVLAVGCGKSDKPKAEVKGAVAFATQEITGKVYQVHIPADWKPFDLTSEQFEESLKTVDVGSNPDQTRAMVRQAKESGIIHFMAFSPKMSDKFAPNMNIVVIPNPVKDLNIHLEESKKQLETVGKVLKAEVDKEAGAVVIEAEIMAGNPKQAVRTYSITKASGKEAVTLNYSYLPSQQSVIGQALDIGKKSFKLK